MAAKYDAGLAGFCTDAKFQLYCTQSYKNDLKYLAFIFRSTTASCALMVIIASVALTTFMRVSAVFPYLDRLWWSTSRPAAIAMAAGGAAQATISAIASAAAAQQQAQQAQWQAHQWQQAQQQHMWQQQQQQQQQQPGGMMVVSPSGYPAPPPGYAYAMQNGAAPISAVPYAAAGPPASAGAPLPYASAAGAPMPPASAGAPLPYASAAGAPPTYPSGQQGLPTAQPLAAGITPGVGSGVPYAQVAQNLAPPGSWGPPPRGYNPSPAASAPKM